jgi:DNA repair protein RecN (Recombination protein N)
MGEIMKEMSQTMQIFAITHLPQIAAKGNAHFKVSKLIERGYNRS